MDRWRHNGRLITIWHCEFDFNESTTGEGFSLPAPSIKEDSTATSISPPIFIFTPHLRRKQEEFECESAAKTGGREWSVWVKYFNVQPAKVLVVAYSFTVISDTTIREHVNNKHPCPVA